MRKKCTWSVSGDGRGVWECLYGSLPRIKLDSWNLSGETKKDSWNLCGVGSRCGSCPECVLAALHHCVGGARIFDSKNDSSPALFFVGCRLGGWELGDCRGVAARHSFTVPRRKRFVL